MLMVQDKSKFLIFLGEKKYDLNLTISLVYLGWHFDCSQRCDQGRIFILKRSNFMLPMVIIKLLTIEDKGQLGVTSSEVFHESLENNWLI